MAVEICQITETIRTKGTTGTTQAIRTSVTIVTMGTTITYPYDHLKLTRQVLHLIKHPLTHPDTRTPSPPFPTACLWPRTHQPSVSPTVTSSRRSLPLRPSPRPQRRPPGLPPTAEPSPADITPPPPATGSQWQDPTASALGTTSSYVAGPSRVPTTTRKGSVTMITPLATGMTTIVGMMTTG